MPKKQKAWQILTVPLKDLIADNYQLLDVSKAVWQLGLARLFLGDQPRIRYECTNAMRPWKWWERYSSLFVYKTQEVKRKVWGLLYGCLHFHHHLIHLKKYKFNFREVSIASPTCLLVWPAPFPC